MKRILTLLLISVMLLSIFALVSCGGENTKKADNVNPNPVTQEKTRYTITKDEFDYNMNTPNFSVDFTFKNGDVVGAKGQTYYTENAVKSVGVSNDGTKVERYTVKNGDRAYIVYDNNGSITVETTTWSPFTFSRLILFDVVKYDNIEYSEENQCYIYRENDATINLYFENGKICKIVMEIGESDSLRVQTYIITNVGTTVVEVPEFDRP